MPDVATSFDWCGRASWRPRRSRIIFPTSRDRPSPSTSASYVRPASCTSDVTALGGSTASTAVKSSSSVRFSTAFGATASNNYATSPRPACPRTSSAENFNEGVHRVGSGGLQRGVRRGPGPSARVTGPTGVATRATRRYARWSLPPAADADPRSPWSLRSRAFRAAGATTRRYRPHRRRRNPTPR